MPLFFWFDLFLEARAEILNKIRWFFGRNDGTKRHFEKNWPLSLPQFIDGEITKQKTDLFPTSHFFISLSANLSITLNLKCIFCLMPMQWYTTTSIYCALCSGRCTMWPKYWVSSASQQCSKDLGRTLGTLFVSHSEHPRDKPFLLTPV